LPDVNNSCSEDLTGNTAAANHVSQHMHTISS